MEDATQGTKKPALVDGLQTEAKSFEGVEQVAGAQGVVGRATDDGATGSSVTASTGSSTTWTSLGS